MQAGLVIGPIWTVGSIVMDAWGVFSLGLPLKIQVAIGLGIFFASVIGLVVGQQRELQALKTEKPELIRQGEVFLELGEAEKAEEPVREKIAEELVRPAKDKLWNIYKDFARPAFTQTDKYLEKTAMVLHSDNDIAKHNIGVFLKENLIPQARKAHNNLVRALRPDSKLKLDSEQLQNLFGDLFDNYRQMVQWLGRGVEITGQPFADGEQFKEWGRKDYRLRYQLNKIVQYSDLYRLRFRVEHIGIDQDIPIYPLPPDMEGSQSQ